MKKVIKPKFTDEPTFTPEMTATAMMMARDAAQRSRMDYLMAKALLTGKLESRVISWAEQSVAVYERFLKEK